MPKGFNQYLQDDMNWVAAFGLKRIAYEGGPSLDNLTANQSVPASVLSGRLDRPADADRGGPEPQHLERQTAATCSCTSPRPATTTGG